MDSVPVLVLVALGVLVFLLRLATPPKQKKKKEPKETTRWHVYHLHFENLHKAGKARSLIIEGGPDKTKLLLDTPPDEARHVVLTDREEKQSIQLDRGFFSRHRLQISVNNQPVVAFRTGRKGTPRAEFLKKAHKCSVQGNLKDREFELRRDDCLVAIVSRRGAETVDGSREGSYRVETLKGEKPLPLLGVLVGLEVALGRPPSD